MKTLERPVKRQLWREHEKQPYWLPWAQPVRHPRLVTVNENYDAAKAPNRIPRPTIAERRRFDALADQWARETEVMSSHSRAVMHRAYQQIISIGPAAIPLLLERLREKPDQWFWALSILTDEDPAEGLKRFEQVRKAWLEWGRDRGFLDG